MERTHSISLRFCVVGGIALALLIPLFMIGGLADEREAYFHEAVSSVAAGWGDAQIITGPLLLIPRLDTARGNGWRISAEEDQRQDVVLIAQTLDTTATLAHEVRQRGIFAIPVYQAEVAINGGFDLSQAAHQEDLDWQQAKLVFGISAAKGVRDAQLKIDDQTVRLQAGTGFDWLGDGLHAQIDLSAMQHVNIDFTLALRGINRFSATLPGARSKLTVESTWPHPSFSGRFLPDSSIVDDDGFTATWAAHELARGFPPSWIARDDPHVLHDKAISIELYEPVTPYRSVERGIKYGALFLAATFLTLLSFELTTHIRFHFVQYAVMGAALVLFYLSLLSLAEHIYFGAAFTVATGVVLSITGWYMHRVTGNPTLTQIFVGVLSAVYAILYMLLRMEAYALIAGTLALTLGLMVLMWTTQHLAERSSDEAT